MEMNPYESANGTPIEQGATASPAIAALATGILIGVTCITTGLPLLLIFWCSLSETTSERWRCLDIVLGAVPLNAPALIGWLIWYALKFSKETAASIPALKSGAT
jgi:hypothetical protein